MTNSTAGMFSASEIPADNPLREHLDDINRSIDRARSFLRDVVDISSIDDLPMIRSQVEIFFQAHLRRALALLEGGRHAYDGGHGLITIAAVRCLFESAACIHDFCNQVIALLDAQNIADAVRLAHIRSFAQRFEVKQKNTEDYDYTAVNILKQIDAMGKVVSHARRSYDQLSEAVHPNAYGSLHYFMQPREGDGIGFGKSPEVDTLTIGLLIEGASLFGLIVDDYMRMEIRLLDLISDTLQQRIDDYEARKLRGDLPST